MASWSSCFGLMRPKREVAQKPKMKPVSVQESIRDQPSSSSGYISLPNPARASSDPEALSPYRRVKNFTYRQLATATNNFSLDSRIGQGGFGDVYKGQLEINGQMEDVAIKMLDRSGNQGNKEFLVEALMLSIYRNEHLVKLYGYCAEDNQRSLVYEYMPLGSVEDRIHNFASVHEVLDLSTRMKIALGAAKGLAYLHNDAEPTVIYRDMKTANILLDHGYKTKLSDFGLARFGPDEGKSHVSTRVMGTRGYCAPEYAATGQLTLKSDIYSFGVVILELVTGRRPINGDSSMGAKRFLVKWALPYFRAQNIRKITDPTLSIQAHPYLEKAARRAIELAYMCVRETAKARPTISEVVRALEVIVGDIEKGKSIRDGRGVGKEKIVEGSVSSPEERTRMLTVNEEEEEGEDLKRKRAVADAKKWAGDLRALQRKSHEPTKTNSLNER